MFCKECGSPVQDSAQFCPVCGAKIVRPTGTAGAPQGAPASGQAQGPAPKASQPAAPQPQPQPVPLNATVNAQQRQTPGGSQFTMNVNASIPQPGAGASTTGGFTAQASAGRVPPQQPPVEPQQPPQSFQPAAAKVPVQTDRSILVYILLTICTCGIYGIYFTWKMFSDTQRMAGEEETGLGMFVLLSIVTCGIYTLYVWYKTADLAQQAAPRYGLVFTEGGTNVLLWILVGWLICGIGEFIGMNNVIKNVNTLAQAYNASSAR